MDFKNFVLLYIIGMSLSGAAWGSLNSLFDNEGKRLHVTAVGAVQKALKNEGWTADEIKQFLSIPVNSTTARANDIRRAAIEAHVRRLAGTDTPVAIAAMAPAAVAAAAVGGDAQPERPVAPSRQSQASASAASAAAGGPEQRRQQPQQRPVARTPMAAAAMARAEALGDPHATSTPARAATSATASASSARAQPEAARPRQPQQQNVFRNILDLQQEYDQATEQRRQGEEQRQIEMALAASLHLAKNASSFDDEEDDEAFLATMARSRTLSKDNPRFSLYEAGGTYKIPQGNGYEDGYKIVRVPADGTCGYYALFYLKDGRMMAEQSSQESALAQVTPLREEAYQLIRSQHFFNNRVRDYAGRYPDKLSGIEKDVKNPGFFMDVQTDTPTQDNHQRIESLADLMAEVLNRNLEVYHFEDMDNPLGERKLRLIHRYQASQQSSTAEPMRLLHYDGPWGAHFDALVRVEAEPDVPAPRSAQRAAAAAPRAVALPPFDRAGLERKLATLETHISFEPIRLSVYNEMNRLIQKVTKVAADIDKGVPVNVGDLDQQLQELKNGIGMTHPTSSFRTLATEIWGVLNETVQALLRDHRAQ